jgi:hypothetical protein
LWQEFSALSLSIQAFCGTAKNCCAQFDFLGATSRYPLYLLLLKEKVKGCRFHQG